MKPLTSPQRVAASRKGVAGVKNVAVVLFLGALFGLLSGHLVAGLNSWGEAAYRSAWDSHPLRLFELFGVFGLDLAEIHSWDWGCGEAWDFRHQVALWNITFWTPVFLVSYGVYIIYRSTNRSSSEAQVEMMDLSAGANARRRVPRIL